MSLALFEVSLEHPSPLDLLQPCAPLHFQQAPWFGCHRTPSCPLPQAAGTARCSVSARTRASWCCRGDKPAHPNQHGAHGHVNVYGVEEKGDAFYQ